MMHTSLVVPFVKDYLTHKISFNILINHGMDLAYSIFKIKTMSSVLDR